MIRPGTSEEWHEPNCCEIGGRVIVQKSISRLTYLGRQAKSDRSLLSTTLYISFSATLSRSLIAIVGTLSAVTLDTCAFTSDHVTTSTVVHTPCQQRHPSLDIYRDELSHTPCTLHIAKVPAEASSARSQMLPEIPEECAGGQAELKRA